jgi:hypothetical protein
MGWDVPHTSVCSITSTTVETTALCRLSTFKSRSRRRQRNLRPTLGLGQRPDALEEWQEANIPARGPLPRGAPDADLPRAKAGTSLRPPPWHTTVLGGMWWCVMVAPNGSESRVPRFGLAYSLTIVPSHRDEQHRRPVKQRRKPR